MAAVTTISPALCQETPPPLTWSAESLQVLQEIARELPAHGLDGAAIDQNALSLVDAKSADALAGRLARILSQGAVEPALAERTWAVARNAVDVSVPMLRKLSATDLASTLRGLAPQNSEYAALRAAYAAASLEEDDKVREAKRASIAASLERWRWLPRAFPPDRVEVRLAQFELRVVRSDRVVATHKVIIGARATPTPSFSAQIEAVTINPHWRPPTGIAMREVLPMMRRSPQRALREGYRLIDLDGRVLTPLQADLSRHPFAYTIVQEPGPHNALGAIKLELPNPYAVYLHDTPSKALYDRTVRAFSHGCVRVENAQGLAQEVLSDPVWSEVEIQSAISAGATKRLDLATPLPVYLLYLTAEPAADGAISIAPDVYGRDKRLAAKLKKAGLSAP